MVTLILRNEIRVVEMGAGIMHDLPVVHFGYGFHQWKGSEQD